MSEHEILTPPLEIEPSFLDYNGHVNMAYHLVMADRALDVAMEPIKGVDYISRRRMTTFAVEMHVRYVREISMGDVVRGRVRWLASDAKRVHWTVELVRDDGEIATTVEGVSLSVSIESRRSAPFPDDVAASFEDGVGRHAELPAPDWIGRRVSM